MIRATRSGAEFDAISAWANTHLHELLTRYAPGAKLDRSGRGPCPIHGGDGPNFSITEGKGWHCFTGCNGGGDGVDLVRRLTGRGEGTAGRVEVLRELAPLAGVSLTTSPTPARARPQKPVHAPPVPKAPPSPLEELRADGCTPASAVTVHTVTLRDVLTLGPRGAAYLEGRGFSPADAATYGFRSLETQGEWEALEAFLAESYLEEERAAAGVGVEGWPAGVGPALVIPYRSSDGAGFCGFRLRSLTNAPNGWRYRSLKGYSLPLPFNGDALTECTGHELHVVEGELNAYALTCHGLRAIGLAGAGTWRPEWSEAIRHAERVVAWYDGDKAGDKGRAKLAVMLAEVCGSAWVKSHGRFVTLHGQDVNDRHHAGTLSALISDAGWRK